MDEEIQANEYIFKNKVKLTRLKDNYRVAFGLFKEVLNKDAIKRLVAEINMAVYNVSNKENATIEFADDNVSMSVNIPLSKKDEVTIIVPFKVIDKDTYIIQWDEAIIIPYIRGKEMKLTKPEKQDVDERLKKDEEEGIDGI